MKLTHRVSTIVLAATTAVAFTACSGSGSGASSDPSAAGDMASSPASASTEASAGASAEASGGSASVSPEVQAVLSAVKSAEDHVDGKAYSIEKDNERWDIYVARDDRSVEVEIRDDGSVGDTDEYGLEGRDRDALTKATVTLSDALTQALEKGGSLDEAEIDVSGDNVRWQIEVYMDGEKTTVYIPAM